MPNQPDSLDIEQLRARLDAIYAPAVDSAETPRLASPTNTYRPASVVPDVARLTMEARSFSPDNEMIAKAERVAIYGSYINSLRMHRLESK